MPDLLPWQVRFVRGALAPGVRTAALSLPRGNGKSTLAAMLAARALTPGDSLFVAGAESHLAAASIGQARRTVFRVLRELLSAAPGYRFAESVNACHVLHVASGTRVSVLAANGKTAQGLVRCPLLIADEPGAWEAAGGAVLHDAIQTAQGKPGAALRAVYIGTLAPARGGWWHDLVNEGSGGSVYVQALRGDPAKWDRAAEIRRCNPLMWTYPQSRRVLFEERDKARADGRLKGRFLSYRMNAPTADESAVLLTVDDWQRVEARDLGAPAGRPVVGVDLGGGRAWSAAVAVWPSGRVEALAVAPGQPAIGEQERRDRVPQGTYARLAAAGVLTTDGDRRVPRVEVLLDRVMAWRPVGIVCDRFRLAELQDAARGRVPIAPRVTRWSEASDDIRALRRLALDGPLSVAPASRGLLAASLAAAAVKNDEQGSVRLTKSGSNNTARDDVAAALVLAAGAHARRPAAPSRPLRLVRVA